MDTHRICDETTAEWLQAFAHQGVHDLEQLLQNHAAFHTYTTEHNKEEPQPTAAPPVDPPRSG